MFNLDIEMGITLPFRECGGATRHKGYHHRNERFYQWKLSTSSCTEKGQLQLRRQRWRWCHPRVGPFVSTTKTTLRVCSSVLMESNSLRLANSRVVLWNVLTQR